MSIVIMGRKKDRSQLGEKDYHRLVHQQTGEGKVKKAKEVQKSDLVSLSHLINEHMPEKVMRGCKIKFQDSLVKNVGILGLLGGSTGNAAQRDAFVEHMDDEQLGAIRSLFSQFLDSRYTVHEDTIDKLCPHRESIHRFAGNKINGKKKMDVEECKIFLRKGDQDGGMIGAAMVGLPMPAAIDVVGNMITKSIDAIF